LRARYGLLLALNGAGELSDAGFGLKPRTVLMAVQMEGPRFSTRTSVGERPSEKMPLGLGFVNGVTFVRRVGLGRVVDGDGDGEVDAWEAFRT